MTLPPIPDDLNCSEAHWKAALDMASKQLEYTDFDNAIGFGLTARQSVKVAALLIKAGEVPEPVDPVEEAWGNVVRDIGMGRADIRQAVERYFICTVKP